MEIPEIQVRLARRVPRDHRATQARREQKVQPERQVPKDKKETPVLQDLRAQQACRGRLAHPDRLDKMVPMAKLVSKATPVQLEPRALLGRLELKVRLAQRVLKVLPVLPVLPVLRVRRAQLESKDQQVQLVSRARQGLRVHKEQQAQRVPRDHPEWTGLMERRDHKVILAP